MYDKIYIIDFDDSFTHNIANVLYPVVPQAQVIYFGDFFEDEYFERIEKVESKIGIILGPGPGHPNDYRVTFEKIKRLKFKLNVYLVGICLGHQILAIIDGLEINYSNNKVHGIPEKIDFKESKVWVMRYNSLAVFKSGIECNWREGERFISYQFHPESVGTGNKVMFFQSLLDFIT